MFEPFNSDCDFLSGAFYCENPENMFQCADLISQTPSLSEKIDR